MAEVNKTVLIGVAVLLVAVLFPAAYNPIAGQATTTKTYSTWTNSTTPLGTFPHYVTTTSTYTWPAAIVATENLLMPILGIIGIAMLFLGGTSVIRGRGKK